MYYRAAKLDTSLHAYAGIVDDPIHAFTNAVMTASVVGIINAMSSGPMHPSVLNGIPDCLSVCVCMPQYALCTCLMFMCTCDEMDLHIIMHA